MSPRKVRVVAVLIRRGEDILVQQRLPTGSRPLLWEFPGGKVEAGETDEHALVRECREELGVEIEVDERAWTCVHTYPDLEVELVLYRCRLTAGEPRPLLAHALRFEPVSGLATLPFCEADIPFVEKLSAGEL